MIGILTAAGPALAQFSDQTSVSGLLRYSLSWGAALADIDNDGDLDIYAGHHFAPPLLYWNDGNGSFSRFIHPQPWTGALDRHGPLLLTLNNDELPDILVLHGGAGGAGSEPNEVYRNDGGTSFTPLVGAAGMDDPLARARAAAAADVNGDRRADIWVGKAPRAASHNALFKSNGQFSFTDVAVAAQLADSVGAVGGIFGDADGDGDPDLFTGGDEFGSPSSYFRNFFGTFINVSGIFSPPLPVVSGADWGDADGDGDLDLAVCDGGSGIFDTYAEGDSVSFFFATLNGEDGLDVLTVPSAADTLLAQLRLNGNEDPLSVFLGPSGVNPSGLAPWSLTDDYVGAPAFTAGVDRGVFVWRTAAGGPWVISCSTPNTNADNFDGWLTDGTPITGVVAGNLEPSPFVPGAPRIYRNDGFAFRDVSAALGLPAAMLNPRDISWVDFDNDGDLDLHVVDQGTSAEPNAPDALFRNDGGTFVDVAAAEGVAAGTGTGVFKGMGDGGVWGDLDNDGDLDLYLKEGAGPVAFSFFGPANYYRNDGPRGNSIQLDLVGVNPGIPALGAKVRVVVDGQSSVRWVTANAWRGFQDPLRVHLGIGAAQQADSLLISWPGGAGHAYVNVPPGIYRIVENQIALDAAVPAVAPAAGRLAWTVADPSPQPFRSGQTLRLGLERGVDLEVSVHDVAGRRLRTIHRGPLAPGETGLLWDGRDDADRPLPAGVYFYRISDGTMAVTRRAVLLR